MLLPLLWQTGGKSGINIQGENVDQRSLDATQSPPPSREILVL